MLLLPVIDGEHGPLDERRDLRRELVRHLEHLALGCPGLQERHFDLRVPPVRLGLGDPAQALAVDPQPPLDDDRPEAPRHLELDGRDHLQLVVPDRVVRVRLGEPHRLANHRQQFEGKARPLAQLGEGRVAETGEAVVAGGVQEGERQGAAPHRLAHPIERQARPLQALDHPHAADVPGRERAAGVGGEDPPA
jgi:hypothetical protein